MADATDLVELTTRLAAIAPSIVEGARGVADVRRLSGGAVNEMWAFDVEPDDGAAVPLVLRRGVGGERTYYDAISIATEAAVVTRAADHGVPVARPRYTLQPRDGLGAGFVGDRIDGETIGGRILRLPELAEARAGLAHRCGEVLATIHAIDPAGLDLETRTAASFVDDLTGRYHRLPQPRPVLALALRWIHEHVPAETVPRLVHGDFRNGNLIVGPNGLRAVLDWEGAHLSDPMADLGFLCINSWRFGGIDKPVGGFGDREDLLAGYAAAGGVPDAERAYFWQVFGTFRWGVMCASMATGAGVLGSSPVEAALIARRTSESEIDLLDLVTGRRG